MRDVSRKKPKYVLQKKPEKTPKWQNEPTIDGEGPLSWRFSVCDRDGPFSWHALTSDEAHQVMTRLAEFETKNWSQVTDTGSHAIASERLCKIARDRLGEIKHDDVDELMSFRIEGAGRVWCIRSGSLMRVLWWDPRHEVYPTPKDKGDREKLRNR